MLHFYDFKTNKQETFGNGVFQKLKDIFKVDDISSNIITLGALELGDPTHPLNFVLFPEESYWISSPIINSYIEVGFYHNKVKLSSIQIRTTYRDLFNTYTFYGINNGEEPIEIGKGNIKSEDYKDVNAFVDYDYPINNLNSWNRIRIQGDGQRAAKDYYLVIHLLELQGQFFANNLYVTCNKNFKIHFNLNELYVFLIKF